MGKIIKILFLSILFISISTPCFSSDFASFEEGRNNFIQNKKPFIVIISGNGCLPCEYLHDTFEIMQNKELKGYNICEINRSTYHDQELLKKIMLKDSSGNFKGVPQTIIYFYNNGYYRVGFDGAFTGDNAHEKNKTRILKFLEVVK